MVIPSCLRLSVTGLFGAAVILCPPTHTLLAAKASPNEASVTRIIRDVKLLPEQAKPRPAVLNEKVKGGVGVQTGDRSRSELTFIDLTIERLGANTIFSFGNGGRQVELESGSMLLRVPKDSGGAQLTTSAVTVGVTGTTVILETAQSGQNRLYVLEGGANILLNKYPKQSVFVQGGQMEDVPPGATKLPRPIRIKLRDLMKKHPLITDFPPLPSENLINATADNPPRPLQGLGGPGFFPPIVGGLFGGPGRPPGRLGGGRPGGGGVVGQPGGGTVGTTNPTRGSATGVNATTVGKPKPQASPTPRRQKGP